MPTAANSAEAFMPTFETMWKENKVTWAYEGSTTMTMEIAVGTDFKAANQVYWNVATQGTTTTDKDGKSAYDVTLASSVTLFTKTQLTSGAATMWTGFQFPAGKTFWSSAVCTAGASPDKGLSYAETPVSAIADTAEITFTSTKNNDGLNY